MLDKDALSYRDGMFLDHFKREVSLSGLYFSSLQVGLSNGKGEGIGGKKERH